MLAENPDALTRAASTFGRVHTGLQPEREKPACHAPMGAGTAGLAVTGIFSGPDVDSPLTQVKLVSVLVIALN